ncbi:MAG: hypothetical protein EON93_06385 [Burkholderiales bacterium]|nr:MAG: hypothetical protein EON93_06385 [Burkholderiales bacterium]
METGIIMAVLVVLWLLWNARKFLGDQKRPLARSKPAAPARAPVDASGEMFRWPPLGGFDFEVVGESNYQKTLQRIAGDHGKDNVAAECTAVLTPEDDNAYDKSAVQVTVDGDVVGYLSRDDARSFRRRLGRKGLSGQSTNCDAKVVGGRTQRGGEKLKYGIQLDLKPFEN